MKNPILVIADSRVKGVLPKYFEMQRTLQRRIPVHFFLSDDRGNSGFFPVLLMPGKRRQFDLSPVMPGNLERVHLLYRAKERDAGLIDVSRHRLGFDYLPKSSDGGQTLRHRFKLVSLTGRGIHCGSTQQSYEREKEIGWDWSRRTTIADDYIVRLRSLP